MTYLNHNFAISKNDNLPLNIELISNNFKEVEDYQKILMLSASAAVVTMFVNSISNSNFASENNINGFINNANGHQEDQNMKVQHYGANSLDLLNFKNNNSALNESKKAIGATKNKAKKPSVKVKTRRIINQPPCVVCPVCGKKFRTTGTLEIHVKSHKNSERPFLCKYCGKGFMQQTHLKQHERCHTNERPYICNFCDKSFAQKSGVIQHERIHTGEKPYICRYCPKSYRQMSGLKQHLTKHKEGEASRDGVSELLPNGKSQNGATRRKSGKNTCSSSLIMTPTTSLVVNASLISGVKRSNLNDSTSQHQSFQQLQRHNLQNSSSSVASKPNFNENFTGGQSRTAVGPSLINHQISPYAIFDMIGDGGSRSSSNSYLNLVNNFNNNIVAPSDSNSRNYASNANNNTYTTQNMETSSSKFTNHHRPIPNFTASLSCYNPFNVAYKYGIVSNSERPEPGDTNYPQNPANDFAALAYNNVMLAGLPANYFLAADFLSAAAPSGIFFPRAPGQAHHLSQHVQRGNVPNAAFLFHQQQQQNTQQALILQSTRNNYLKSEGSSHLTTPSHNHNTNNHNNQNERSF